MRKRWHYNGDVNLEYGGFWWREDGADDYVLAVRVTPCSDAGGPDNLFHVERGSIYLPQDAAGRATRLSVCGYIDPPDANPATARTLYVDAAIAYGGIERDTYRGETVVQVGAKLDDCAEVGGWQPTPDVILRGNASLRRYIKREFLD